MGGSAATSTVAKHRPLVRGLALGACTLLLAIAVVVGSGTLPSSNSLVGSNDTGNSFALAAYAAGKSNQKGQFASLKRDFGTLAGFGWSDNNGMESAYLRKEDPDSSPNDTKGFASVHLFLNLSCVGKNVDTLTYSIEGDGAYFYQENWNYGPPSHSSGPDPDPQIQKKFTISYDEQAKDAVATQRQLYFFFPLDEKTREVYNANDGAPKRSVSATSSTEN